MREQHTVSIGRKGKDLAARGPVRRLVQSTGSYNIMLNDSL